MVVELVLEYFRGNVARSATPLEKVVSNWGIEIGQSEIGYANIVGIVLMLEKYIFRL